MTDQQTDQQTNDDQGGDDRAPVPYRRFQQINTKYRQALAELEAARKGKGGDGQPVGDDTKADVSQAQQALLEAAQAEIAALKRARLQDKLALETGVPLEMAPKIAGDTEEAMRADAEAMARYVGQSRRPVAPNIDGGTPDAAPPAKITLDGINDPVFYAKNRDRIFDAVKQGRVRG